MNSSRFRVAQGRVSRLSDSPTETRPVSKSKAHYRKLLAERIEELSALQSLLYAHDPYALLLIFQAMERRGQGQRDQACDVGR
jgi:hypothetical protein